MNYTIASIPTTFNGVDYRSRLEAKWASFFYLCGWNYTYEPENFVGWFPDFLIVGDEGNRIWIEVKPISLGGYGEHPTEITDVMEKATTHKGMMDELLLLGDGPVVKGRNNDSQIGWLNEIFICREDPSCPFSPNNSCGKNVLHNHWAGAMFGTWIGSERLGAGSGSRKSGFCHGNDSYRDRITGGYDGGCYGEGSPLLPQTLWRKAVKAVQYRRV